MARIAIVLFATFLLVGAVLALGLGATTSDPAKPTPEPDLAAACQDCEPADLTGALSAEPTAALPAAPTPEPPTPTPAEADTQTDRARRFRVIVDEHLGDLQGTFGVIVRDLETGETVAINPDRLFPAASLYKLGLMYEVLRQAEAGELEPTTIMDITERHMVAAEFDEKLVPGLGVTIDRSLWFLITLSSNSAATALFEHVTPAEVNRAMRSIGLPNTRLPGDPDEPAFGDWRDELASTTPAEMLSFFERIYRRGLLTEEASEKMMWLLLNQQVDDRLSVKLPPEAEIAHKTGNLSGVINNVGIIFGPRSDLYVGVMTEGADYEPTTAALQDLGLALYREANRP